MFKVAKCDWCENGHKDGIKTLVIHGEEIKFCSACGPQIKMVHAVTGEEKSISEIWYDIAKDNDETN